MLGFVGNRKWVYQLSVTGKFQRLRKWTFLGLHLLLFVTPWLSVGGNPAARIDLPGRTVYLFGAIYTATDMIFLLLLLLFLAFALFFFTSLFGRVWCGYACPQTVFLDSLIRPIEQKLEGPRGQRMKLDRAPWTSGKVTRKLLKWGIFALIAIAVAGTFGSYFTGPIPLWTGRASPEAYLVTGVFAAIWFLDFTWFREQFCNLVCPYARFQGALADDESLTITYIPARGEPRGGANAGPEGRCIECDKCVAVCPQGIDIRDGFQMECIACAACIDACEDVMAHFGQPTLVAYGSLAAQEGRHVRTFRPRTMVYGGLLAALAGATVILAIRRTPIEAQVSRVRGSLFQVDGDGWVRNTYMLRVTNKAPDRDTLPFSVNVKGLEGAQVTVEPIRLGSTESRFVPVIVRIPPAHTMARTFPITVTVASPSRSVNLASTFLTPGTSDVPH